MEENTTMDNKLEESVKSLWGSLTDEQREKAKQCKTVEELTELAAKESVELPDEVVDAVAGGYVHKTSDGRFEVINDKSGASMKTDDYLYQARGDAIGLGQRIKVINDKQLDRLRATGSIC